MMQAYLNVYAAHRTKNIEQNFVIMSVEGELTTSSLPVATANSRPTLRRPEPPAAACRRRVENVTKAKI